MDAMSLGSHNSRVSQIRKFVTAPPARGKVLRLVTTHPTQQSLGEWLRAQCENNANVALEVSELLQEHSNTTQRRTEASLAWLDGETPRGLVVAKTLKARPAATDEDDGEDDNQALGIDGTQVGQVVQMQRHMEVMARSYFTAHQSQIVTANEQTRALYEENRALHMEVARLRSCEVKLQALEASIALSEQVDENATGPETDAARAELIRTSIEGLKKAGPMVYGLVLKWAAEQARKQAASEAAAAAGHHAQAAE